LDKYLAQSTLPFIKVKGAEVIAVKEDTKYDAIEAGEASGSEEGLEMGYEVSVKDHQSKTVEVNAI
jgi:hypothetical protein